MPMINTATINSEAGINFLPPLHSSPCILKACFCQVCCIAIDLVNVTGQQNYCRITDFLVTCPTRK